MSADDDNGGFADVREEVDGHPMVGLLRYARAYWGRLALGIGSSITTRLARLVPPIIVGAAIDRVINQSAEPGLLADLGLVTAAPATTTAARLGLLQRLALIAVIAYLVRSVTRFAERYLLEATAQKIQRDLRNDTYDHMQRLSLDFFANHQTGAMMSILNNDINQLETFLSRETRQIIRVVATVGGIGAVLLVMSPPLAAIVLIPVPIIGYGSVRFLTWIEPKYKEIRESVARLNSRLENNISGAKVIKAFDRYGFERERVGDQSQAYHDEQIAALKIRRGFFATIRLFTGLAFVGVLLVGGEMVITGGYTLGALSLSSGITAGTFTMFFLYLRRMYSPMRRIGRTANQYQRAKSSAERVFGLLGHEPTITPPADPVTEPIRDGRVAFDDVTFSYEGRGENVLSNISLDVDAGETIGLAGETGAGKSTLVKLIPRFYDVDSGAVSVDDVDVREYDLQHLRRHVGVVEQDPYLFSGTVEENIAYGDLSTLDGEGIDSRIVDAARAAEAHEFIADLPDGYETQIGERGVKLSGGQRQRLSIARALLNDPEIIILDEATSDVDTETEELIQASLRRLIADRTAFVIAHRLSTIQDADRIVVMADGEIIEEGPHDDLLAAEGAYADLWEAQTDDDDDAAELPALDD
ncbi:ABC transporter ATP-binding protein [Halonotius terrestris]|uniref:ABC transporter ATP-binding protein n=1 Tax=Halonotius terrestris TaxID=2487750 RepID=A0A8J8TBV2_9EURY|nr:ABC transporter ATP-binding protein [Halonotius terrestris]TQQ82755.1 ABC transporter ATP-binding protein [Halonotius terrestris]